MKRRRKKLPFSYRVFDFPAHLASGGSEIKIYENIGASIENYGKIIEFSEKKLVICTENGTIEITGESMSINETDVNALMITGDIRSLIFAEVSEIQ